MVALEQHRITSLDPESQKNQQELKALCCKVFRLKGVVVTLLNDYVHQALISVFSKILLGHKAEVKLNLM